MRALARAPIWKHLGRKPVVLFRLHFRDSCHRSLKLFSIALLGALVEIFFGNECRGFLSQSQRNQLSDLFPIT
jgi:hypothetical protein